MNKDETLIRPETLDPGRKYLMREKTGAAGEIKLAPVTFIKEDPCPALVIVKNGERRVRCPREDIFIHTDQ